MEPADAFSLLPIAENDGMTFGRAAKCQANEIGFGLEHTFCHWLKHLYRLRSPIGSGSFSEFPKEPTKPAQFEPAPLSPCRDHAKQPDHE